MGSESHRLFINTSARETSVALKPRNTARQIIERDGIYDKEEAKYLAQFFWEMAHATIDEERKAGQSSQYILVKIIVTLMGYYRAAGYEDAWKRTSDATAS